MSEQGKASSQRDPTVISEIKRDPVDTDGHGHVAQTTGASCGPFGPDAPCCGFARLAGTGSSVGRT
jgi:hypothetical protein